MIERLVLNGAFALLFSTAYALAAWRFGPAVDQWLRARHARRLTARLERGSDRYFEELRELEGTTPAPYVAHGFAWHFVRMLPVMILAVGLPELFRILFSFSFPE
jgi:hypothetical protein